MSTCRNFDVYLHAKMNFIPNLFFSQIWAKKNFPRKKGWTDHSDFTAPSAGESNNLFLQKAYNICE